MPEFVDKSASFIDAGDTRRGAPSSVTFSEHDGAVEWQDPLLFEKKYTFIYNIMLHD